MIDLGDELEAASGSFDGPFDWSAMARNCRRAIVQFGSTDDPLVPIAAQDRVAAQLQSVYHRLESENHFMARRIPPLLSAALALLETEAEDWAGPELAMCETRSTLGAAFS